MTSFRRAPLPKKMSPIINMDTNTNTNQIMDKGINAYLVSHNGMGDNLIMIGALHFLLKFYEKIYFLCPNNHYSNVKLFFINTPNIICVPFNERYERNEITSIMNKNYDTSDIFICGSCHTSYLKSKITNTELLNYTHINKNYTIDYDTITSEDYDFIASFYRDINLNLTYFYDYFYFPSSTESLELYTHIKHYYIVFIQLRSSCGKELNITNLMNKYLHDKNTILICNDKNLYDIKEDDKNTDDIKLKYNICKPFVYNTLINYNDVIINSDEIYIIDSCFIGIILPYLKMNKLKTSKVRIIKRDIAHTVEL